MKTSRGLLWLAAGVLAVGLDAGAVLAQEAGQNQPAAPAQNQAQDQAQDPSPGQDQDQAQDAAPSNAPQRDRKTDRDEGGDRPAGEAQVQKKPRKTRSGEDGAQADAAPKQPEIKLQIFELKTATPQDVLQLLRMHGGFPHIANFGASGGGYPYYLQQQNQPNQPQLRIAADEQKKLLFVRGPEDQLQGIAKIIESFDAPPEQMEPQMLGDKYIMQLRHSDPGQVSQVLQQLQLSSYVMQYGNRSFLVLNSKGAELEQAKEIVARLDAAPEATADASAKKPDQSEASAPPSGQTQAPAASQPAGGQPPAAPPQSNGQPPTGAPANAAPGAAPAAGSPGASN